MMYIMLILTNNWPNNKWRIKRNNANIFSLDSFEDID